MMDISSDVSALQSDFSCVKRAYSQPCNTINLFYLPDMVRSGVMPELKISNSVFNANFPRHDMCYQL